MTNGTPIRPSLKKGRFVYRCPAVYVNSAPNAEPQVCGTKRSKEKSPTTLLLNKGGFVYVISIGIWELSYAAPSSLGQKMKQRKKSYGSNNDCSTV